MTTRPVETIQADTSHTQDEKNKLHTQVDNTKEKSGKRGRRAEEREGKEVVDVRT